MSHKVSLHFYKQSPCSSASIVRFHLFKQTSQHKHTRNHSLSKATWRSFAKANSPKLTVTELVHHCCYVQKPLCVQTFLACHSWKDFMCSKRNTGYPPGKQQCSNRNVTSASIAAASTPSANDWQEIKCKKSLKQVPEIMKKKDKSCRSLKYLFIFFFFNW